MSNLDQIREKLGSYKKRYYKRQVLLGLLTFVILSISLFLLFGYIEYRLWLGSAARTILFFVFLLTSISSLYLFVIKPALLLLNLRKGLEDEQAAKDIALFFPEIEDRLINLLQLGKQSDSENDLITAAIEKKADGFKQITFSNAVDFGIAKKYLTILGSVVLVLLLVSFINPEIVSESPKRIANYSKEFEKEAPFQFDLLNEELTAFRGESFTLRLKLEGDAIPENVYINTSQTSSLKIQPDQNGIYEYTIDRVLSDLEVQYEASGFYSRKYELKVYERPNLLSMNIVVQSPSHTGGERRVVGNTGDITILEGSKVQWQIDAKATETAKMIFDKDSFEVKRLDENQFALEKRVHESSTYDIILQNRYSLNKSELRYSIEVIEDLFPKIKAEFFPDSSTYEFITMAGSISDDYGFSSLVLNYRQGGKNAFTKIPLEINLNTASQSFYANWNIDSLGLSAGSRLEMYLTIADNDGVNGFKSSKSQTFVFQIPTEEEIDELIAEKSEDVENQLDKAQEEAESISERLSEIEDRLKSEQRFDWQEKKMLENVIEDREDLNKQIEELQKQNEDLRKANNQFRQQSSQLQEKSEKMQELLNQLMDEETRKLYEKLKELMKQNSPQDEISQQLQELQKNESNLERDLERALELFKRLKMESALEQNLQKLDTLGFEQESVAEENTQEQSVNEAQQAQEDIQKQFDEFRKKMDQVMEMNQELKRPEALDDFEYEERQIAKELREIQEEMEQMNSKQEGEDGYNSGENDQQQSQEPGERQNGEKQERQNQRKQTQQKQKSAAQKMKNLSQKLSKMQGGMQMEMMQANLDQLRDILDNLVKLSFNQEEIMTEMREVNQSDPRFLELSQNQLKLKDDAKVIQDSLLSLASRVVQISSFVTREVGQINESINETLDFLKDRNRGRALTSQQFAMTSINNLALLLDDTMQQMQMAMSEAMGNGSDDKQQSQGLPDLQELQNQLGQQMEELKGSGKSGRELSEELARLAAEQEMIRRQLEMIKESQSGKPGGGMGGDDLQKAIQMMEQNEIDLVNKRLTQQLVYRQKQIQTRLLEAEKAQREQETDEQREADRPTIISREIPPEFEEYLKQKKKEIELLKTIPIELNPFYKKEVNDYFRRISTEDQE